MLTMAEYLSSDHQVDIFWENSQESEIKRKAFDKFNLNLSRVHFTHNIFSKETSLGKRFSSSKNYDLIIYLSNGSIPLLSCRLFVHFQFPVQWVKRSFMIDFKLRRINKIICNSFFTKSFIDSKFKVKSVVLYPPVDIKPISEHKRENIILTVGRFGMTLEGGNYKKQDVLIGVFKQMVNSGFKNWKLVLSISSKKEDEAKLAILKEMAKGFPVEFLDNPDRNKLFDLYSKAKIYWHASGAGEDLLNHPEKAEHFGISTVEAMGMGVVPVVINAGGQKETVVDKQSGFLWNQTSELIAFTRKLAEDTKLWSQMSLESKKRAAFFSKDNFEKNLSKLL